ncbi:MAG TPA: hypothetical protein VFQ45_22170, partial [Longimicrobium sp.]|nr:hypothetical protein [Longimicrobium sp.]
VAVRVRFDRETVSRRRGGRALYPSRREVRLLDDAGRTYLPSPEGLRALESMGAPQPPLSRPLRPGEAYVTRLVFDLPADARGRRLLIREKDLVTRFLIGHENSPFHPAVAFRVGNERSAP